MRIVNYAPEKPEPKPPCNWDETIAMFAAVFVSTMLAFWAIGWLDLAHWGIW